MKSIEIYMMAKEAGLGDAVGGSMNDLGGVLRIPGKAFNMAADANEYLFRGPGKAVSGLTGALGNILQVPGAGIESLGAVTGNDTAKRIGSTVGGALKIPGRGVEIGGDAVGKVLEFPGWLVSKLHRGIGHVLQGPGYGLEYVGKKIGDKNRPSKSAGYRG